MNYPIQDVLSRLDFAATENGRKFQVLLIGESENIIEAIHTLHHLRYAEVGAWSPLLPVPNSTKLMSILTRYRSRERLSQRCCECPSTPVDCNTFAPYRFFDGIFMSFPSDQSNLIERNLRRNRTSFF